MHRVYPILVVLSAFTLVRCDSGDAASCLSVTPDESYVLAGAAQSTAFVPDSKTYTVRNTCSSEVDLVVEEDERWLDVEIAAFGGVAESGPLAGGASLAVVLEVRYGTDTPERLNQLAPGAYQAEIRFEDTTNDTRVVRDVELTVTAP